MYHEPFGCNKNALLLWSDKIDCVTSKALIYLDPFSRPHHNGTSVGFARYQSIVGATRVCKAVCQHAYGCVVNSCRLEQNSQRKVLTTLNLLLLSLSCFASSTSGGMVNMEAVTIRDAPLASFGQTPHLSSYYLVFEEAEIGILDCAVRG